MSWRATAYVKDQRTTPAGRPLTRSEKLLMHVIADYHNDQTNDAWASNSTLAADALLSRRQAIRILAVLVKDGVLAKGKHIAASGALELNSYSFPGLPPRKLAANPSDMTSPALVTSDTSPSDILSTHPSDIAMSHKQEEKKEQENRTGKHSARSRSSRSSNSPEYTAEFNEFWNDSHKRGSKAEALAVWQKIAPADQLRAHDAMKAQVKAWQANGTEKRFMPHVVRWLRGRRWETPVESDTGTASACRRGESIFQVDYVETPAEALERETINAEAAAQWGRKQPYERNGTDGPRVRKGEAESQIQ